MSRHRHKSARAKPRGKENQFDNTLHDALLTLNKARGRLGKRKLESLPRPSTTFIIKEITHHVRRNISHFLSSLKMPAFPRHKKPRRAPRKDQSRTTKKNTDRSTKDKGVFSRLLTWLNRKPKILKATTKHAEPVPHAPKKTTDTAPDRQEQVANAFSLPAARPGKQIHTEIDAILEIVDTAKSIPLRTLASRVGISNHDAEQWCSRLADRGVINLVYPLIGSATVHSCKDSYTPSHPGRNIFLILIFSAMIITAGILVWFALQGGA